MKQKFSINRLTLAFASLLLAVVLSSCGEENKFPNSQSKFVVTRIEPNKTKGTSIYLAEPIGKMDLNMSHTWFVDSIGRFNAGDTLCFQHYR
jgi:hypothetical protein